MATSWKSFNLDWVNMLQWRHSGATARKQINRTKINRAINNNHVTGKEAMK